MIKERHPPKESSLLKGSYSAYVTLTVLSMTNETQILLLSALHSLPALSSYPLSMTTLPAVQSTFLRMLKVFTLFFPHFFGDKELTL